MRFSQALVCYVRYASRKTRFENYHISDRVCFSRGLFEANARLDLRFGKVVFFHDLNCTCFLLNENFCVIIGVEMRLFSLCDVGWSWLLAQFLCSLDLDVRYIGKFIRISKMSGFRDNVCILLV